MGNWKKWVANVAILVILFSLIVYYVFNEQDPRVLFELLSMADGRYWAAGIVLVFMFVSCESAILRLLLNDVGAPPPKWHCLIYSFIGFFFSAITPAAGGGQPAQVFYMRKDGLHPGVTSPILVVVTIGYKLVLIFYGLLALIIRPRVIFEANEAALWWGAAGFVLNVIVIILFGLVIFAPGLVARIFHFLMNLISRFVKSDRLEKLRGKVERTLDNYKEVTVCIKKNPRLMLVVVLISIFQRSLLFSITWLVLRSFGITAYALPVIIMMQSMVCLGTDLLPLPGGSGANEAFFLLLFEKICGEGMVLPVMIASRGIAFYAQLMICGVLTLVGTNIIKRSTKM